MMHARAAFLRTGGLALAGSVVLRGAARAQNAPAIALGYPPLVGVTPMLYARQAGMFAAAGLDLTATEMRSGAAIAAAIVGGAIQIGSGALQAVINAHAHGVPLVLVAAEVLYDAATPYAEMLVRKDSSLRTARDLNGKTLGTSSLGDLDWVGSVAWIDRNGGDSSTVHFVELPNTAQLAALVAGRIDAYTIGEPWVTIALRSGNVRSIGPSFSAIASHFLQSAYFATKDWAEANADALGRFRRVIADASRYVNAHHPEMVPLVAAMTKQEPAMVAASLASPFATTLDPKLVQPVIDATAKYKVIPKAFPASEIILSGS